MDVAVDVYGVDALDRSGTDGGDSDHTGVLDEIQALHAHRVTQIDQ